MLVSGQIVCVFETTLFFIMSLCYTDGQDDCMEVVISHCEKLSTIDRNAMRHLDLCYVCIYAKKCV